MRISLEVLEAYCKKHLYNYMAIGIQKSMVMRRPIDVRKGVLGGLTPPLRLKIWADPPSWKIFEQVTP